MFLVVLQAIVQTMSSTLHWLGLYVGVRNLPGAKARQSRWIIGSAVISAVWLVGAFLLGAANVLPPLIPVAIFATLLFGYVLLFSETFRGIVAAVPQHWIIGVQTFRVLGGIFIFRYLAGELPGRFALPAGIGDVLTGLAAPIVAYAWFSGKPWARNAAIAWNLFGMADLVDAVTIGTLTFGRVGGAGLVFPLVMIPAYAVPRAFLLHSFSLIGLVRKTSRQPCGEKSLNYGTEGARA